MSVRVRRSRVSLGKCSVMSGYCRNVFCNVGLLSALVPQGRFSVDEVGLLTDRVRRGRLCVGT